MTEHLPCPNCDSSDGYYPYPDGGYCFVCNYKEGDFMSDNLSLKDKKVGPIKDRGITKEACKFYGVALDLKGDEVVTHYYPYYDDVGNHVANKIRHVKDKRFFTEGAFKKKDQNLLFGKNLFPKGCTHTVLITEGELDAIAAYQMLGGVTACVSLPNGASSAASTIKTNFEYLNSFKEIVICFDNDEAGKKAVETAASIIGFGKLKVLQMKGQLKDACDYLKEGKVDEFVKSYWASAKWRPENIIPISSLKDEVFNNTISKGLDYPWRGLNNKLYGIRKGELVTLTAETNVGKTQVLREIVFNLLNQDEDSKVGAFFIEEKPDTTAKGLMSIAGNIPFHKPDSAYTEQEMVEAWEKIANDRVWMFKYFGSRDLEVIINTIKFYVKVLGCEYIVLDHMSILTSDGRFDDERKALDEIVTKLKTLTIELDIAIIAVAHLNRQGFIRGTAGIEQMSDVVIRLKRDKEAEDPIVRKTTEVTVVKNRPYGDTGIASYLLYDENTGRLTETDRPEGYYGTSS